MAYCFGWPTKFKPNKAWTEIHAWQIDGNKASCPSCGHVIRGLREWELPMVCPCCRSRNAGKQTVVEVRS